MGSWLPYMEGLIIFLRMGNFTSLDWILYQILGFFISYQTKFPQFFWYIYIYALQSIPRWLHHHPNSFASANGSNYLFTISTERQEKCHPCFMHGYDFVHWGPGAMAAFVSGKMPPLLHAYVICVVLCNSLSWFQLISFYNLYWAN